MSNKVQEWLQRGEITAARENVHQRSRKPGGIYTIGSGSVEDHMHTTLISARKQGNTSRKHHKKTLSSDSSVIPFAEINPARDHVMNDVVKNNKQSKQRFQNVCATSPEISPKVDRRRTKDFQRRPRYKMRSPSQIKPIVEPKRERVGGPAKKKESRTSRIKDKKQGDILIDELSADNFSKDRLTLRPSHNLGLFKKGRTSTPVKKGLPDLAFSEMKFLDGKSFASPIAQKASPKHKKDKKPRGYKEGNQSFSYFESSGRRLGEKGLRTITISSQGYTEPRKRRRKNDESTPEKSFTEALMAETPVRPSPRSAMADVLRRRGIYSLPVNISSRNSNCGSAVTSGRNRGGESSDDNLPQKKDIDGLSEYSRAGFQKRFQQETKELVRLQKRRSSDPTIETPKYAKEAHNAKSKEKENSYASSVVIKDKKSRVEVVDQARNHAPGIAITNSRSLVPKGIKWCTPDLAEPTQKIPGSSSPLAALLRVCADSPERLGPRRRRGDDGRGGEVGWKDHQSSRIPQRPTFYPQKSVSSQPSEVYQDRPNRPTRPLGVTLTRQLTKIEGLHQQWGHSKKAMNNYAIPPHALCAKTDKYPLSGIQQSEASRNFNSHGPAMTEVYENEKHPDDYADNYPESPLSEAIEGQCSPNLTPYRYTKDSDGQKEFVEDSFMDSSSDYAPGGWIIDDTDRCRLNGPSEERQIHELRHPYTTKTITGRGRSPTMNEGQYNIEYSRHGKGGYVEPVLEDLGSNFWRKHTL